MMDGNISSIMNIKPPATSRCAGIAFKVFLLYTAMIANWGTHSILRTIQNFFHSQFDVGCCVHIVLSICGAYPRDDDKFANYFDSTNHTKLSP